MGQTANPKIKRALVSVSNKKGIVELCSTLVGEHQIEIISTGGTLKALLDAGVKAIDISDFTNFPEMMDGRVKTLHPKVHGGILARRDVDQEVMKDNEIKEIDLVVVNLYPFAETVSKPETTLEVAIENIDIGGPSMLRSAAKNNKHVGGSACARNASRSSQRPAASRRAWKRRSRSKARIARPSSPRR